MRIWFAGPLESAAHFWRVVRRDGVTLGFTSHDRDLMFDGITHFAAPGMQPSAIQLDDALEPESLDVAGALTHSAISEADLMAGRWDGAAVVIGLVDWTAPDADAQILVTGELGSIEHGAAGFTAELRAAKSLLEAPVVPATSPSCRAAFCGPGCTLSISRFSRIAVVTALDAARPVFGGIVVGDYAGGNLRWLDGANAGLAADIWAVDGAALVLDHVAAAIAVGDRAELVEGCDRSMATCATRFDNAANFQGEPFLPGNDLLTRVPG